jgi:hypothetical protein
MAAFLANSPSATCTGTFGAGGLLPLLRCEESRRDIGHSKPLAAPSKPDIGSAGENQQRMACLVV